MTTSEHASQIIVAGGIIKPLNDSQQPSVMQNGAILIGPVSSNSTQVNSQDTYVINLPQNVGQTISTSSKNNLFIHLTITFIIPNLFFPQQMGKLFLRILLRKDKRSFGNDVEVVG